MTIKDEICHFKPSTPNDVFTVGGLGGDASRGDFVGAWTAPHDMHMSLESCYLPVAQQIPIPKC